MLKQLLLSLMLLCVAGVAAASVFEVRIDPAPYSRAEARQQATSLLLSRLTGNQADGSWVQDEILQNWSRYQEQEPAGPGYAVRFSRQELLPLLDSAGLPVWAEPRPALLVWLVKDGEPLDGADADWRHAAGEYQIPLLWPLWDLQEHLQIDKDRLLESAQLNAASQRYGAESWLAVWQQEAALRWRLFSTDSEQPLTEGEAASPDELLASVNAYWVDQRGGMQPQRAENGVPLQSLQAGADVPGELTIVVSGLRRYADVVRLEQRLNGLAGVSRVALLDSAGDEARFRLSLSQPVPAITAALTQEAGLSALGERRYQLTERVQ